MGRTCSVNVQFLKYTTMPRFNYYISKKPHGGFKVGEKVAIFIRVNDEYLTGVLRYFEEFSDGVFAVFGDYRARLSLDRKSVV